MANTSVSSESRSQALRMISESAGFSFREEELSPRLRKEITDVAAQLDHYRSTRVCTRKPQPRSVLRVNMSSEEKNSREIRKC